MKNTSVLGKATRTAGKLFFALTLLFVAVAIGFGGTALFVYHQFGDSRQSSAQSAHGTVADHRPAVRPTQSAAEEGSPSARLVAALPSDQPQYTYADNNGGQPTVPAKRSRLPAAVPAPLDPSTQGVDATDEPGRLNDPESHYIVDSRTGRVVGIDGSEGARREEEREGLQQAELPPQAIAVQTPPPEVRVAAPVLADGQPVIHGVAVALRRYGLDRSTCRYAERCRWAPMRTTTAPHEFNAGEYMMNDQERPVLRAQAVVPPGARVVKTVRIYRLPDGSQTVAAE